MKGTSPIPPNAREGGRDSRRPEAPAVCAPWPQPRGQARRCPASPGARKAQQKGLPSPVREAHGVPFPQLHALGAARRAGREACITQSTTAGIRMTARRQPWRRKTESPLTAPGSAPAARMSDVGNPRAGEEERAAPPARTGNPSRPAHVLTERVKRGEAVPLRVTRQAKVREARGVRARGKRGQRRGARFARFPGETSPKSLFGLPRFVRTSTDAGSPCWTRTLVDALALLLPAHKGVASRV